MMLLQSIKTFIKQYTSILAIRSGMYSLRRFDNGGCIVILMYHKINLERDVLWLSVSPDFFMQQLEFLKSHYKIISLTEAVSMLSYGTISGKYAVLTFDDGYRDNYDYAFPLLKKYDAPATIFVTVQGIETGYFGWYSFDQAILGSKQEAIDLTEFSLGVIELSSTARKNLAILHLHHELKKCSNEKREAVVQKVVSELADGNNCDRIMLTWHEANEMHQSGLVTIGAHTMTHPILTRVDHVRARSEITRSKAIIEEKLGAPVKLFAYPNGREDDFDDDIVEMLKNAGFSVACTTISGLIIGEEDLFNLPRVAVNYDMCEGIGGRFSSEMFEVALKGLFRKR